MKKNWYQLKFWNHGYHQVLANLTESKKVLPRRYSKFNAFTWTPRSKVKVVVIGQDPYPNENHAMGLAFSVPKDVYPLPASLANIYKELYEDVKVVRPNGDLSDWAKQGVLLLNTSLTVEEGNAGSHADIGWKPLIEEVVQTISKEDDGVVFILWGGKAHEYAKFIDEKKHMILKSAHPSPLSAYKGFFGSRPFSKTNFYLESVGKEPIKW